MDAEVVLPGGDDAGESGGEAAVLRERIVELRLVLVFIKAGLRGAHHGQDAVARDLRGPADGVDLARLLDRALAVELAGDVDEVQRGPLGLQAAGGEDAVRLAVRGVIAVKVERGVREAAGAQQGGAARGQIAAGRCV